MVVSALPRLAAGGSLEREEAREVMLTLMRGEASDAQIAALLMGLRVKGESPDELAGFAEAMRESAVELRVEGGPLADTCGTGGDGMGTFNISTTAAFIAAGAGLRIAKHGNRGVSSRCGSADVLEALGVRVEIEPERVRECIESVGMGFLYAPRFHPAMRHVMPARREMGIPTVFNLLGPLTNPAHATCQVLGASTAERASLLAHTLASLGVERAFVVHGSDGMDEFTIAGANQVWEIRQGEVTNYLVDPEDLGIPRATAAELAGGDADENARIVRSILSGEEQGPRLRVSLLNAAAVLVAGGLAEDLRDGLGLAESAVRQGAALKILERMVGFTNAEEDGHGA